MSSKHIYPHDIGKIYHAIDVMIKANQQDQIKYYNSIQSKIILPDCLELNPSEPDDYEDYDEHDEGEWYSDSEDD